MVEVVGRRRAAVAAEKLQPGRVHRHAKRQRVRVCAGKQGDGGIDGYLVGERRQRREDSRTTHDDAVRGVGNLVQRDFVAGLWHVALGLVDRGMNDSVRERQILPREELLIRNKVGGAAFVAVDSPFVGATREARERDIHIVGRPAHEPDGELRDSLQACVTPFEVGARARNHVAEVDRLASLGIRHQANFARLVLKIENLRQRVRGARKSRMRRDIGDLVVADPDFARPGQPL